MPGYKTLIACLLSWAAGSASADEIRVATASNFREPMAALARNFEAETGHRVVAIFGSTGKHFAQIVHGAPFDAFLAADSERPAKLEKNGLAVPGSRFTYARGQLVLWQPAANQETVGPATLNGDGFRYLAIANPGLAPYGQAAVETMQSLGLWPGLESRLVRGENIGQTFQFVVSGNAELGFVAWSQLQSAGEAGSGSYWLVPAEHHQPIDQQAVLLSKGVAAQEFLLYIQSDSAINIIQKFGYLTP